MLENDAFALKPSESVIVSLDSMEREVKLLPWQFYPGNSRIFCGGRLITSPKKTEFIIGLLLISIGFVGFAVFEWSYLALAISPAIPIIDILLIISVIFLMLRAAFMDPGFIIRDNKKSYSTLNKSVHFYYDRNVWYNSEKGYMQLKLDVNGRNYISKYCNTCRIYRPPRAVHCRECNACVLNFDHHCPWLMNCIGKRNYKYFFSYVLTLCIIVVYQFCCLITHLIHYCTLVNRSVPDYTLLYRESIPTFLNVVYHFIIGIFLASLLYYHFTLASTNTTTNEDIKESFPEPGMNPFAISRPGAYCSSIREMQSILCVPTFPTVLDLRGRYTSIKVKSPLMQYRRQGLRETDQLLTAAELDQQAVNNVQKHFQYTPL